MKLSFNKSPKKTSFNIILVLGLIIIFAVLFNYNKSKFGITDGFNYKSAPSTYEQPSGLNNYMSDNNANVPSQPNRNVDSDPSDLLPRGNTEWSDLNNVSEDLKNINLLSAGHHYGINTVGSSLRNPNLQIRSEPIIPKVNIGPWNNTTIDADTTRRSLEIGGCD